MRRSLQHEEARDFVAQTRFAGSIVLCRWPSDAVAPVLPPELRLALPPGARGRGHPVLFVFGAHDRSAVLFAALHLSTGARFLEMMIAVPFVQHADGGGPYLFVPRVFSGEPVATWSGNAHYGFGKRLVPMEWLGDTFVVGDDRGALAAHASVEGAGPWRRAPRAAPPGRRRPRRAERDPRLAWTAVVSRLPVLGRRADGSAVTSRFEWGFEDAWVRPIRARVSLDAHVGPGLGPRVSFGSPSCSVAVSGMRWRLSWPARPSPLRCAPTRTPQPGPPARSR